MSIRVESKATNLITSKKSVLNVTFDYRKTMAILNPPGKFTARYSRSFNRSPEQGFVPALNFRLVGHTYFGRIALQGPQVHRVREWKQCFEDTRKRLLSYGLDSTLLSRVCGPVFFWYLGM